MSRLDDILGDYVQGSALLDLLEELRDEAADLDNQREFFDSFDEMFDDSEIEDWLERLHNRPKGAAMDEEDYEDLQILEGLEDEIGRHDSLIHDNVFEEYVQEWVSDARTCLTIPDIISDYVDWNRFSEDLKSDYSEVEIKGNTYYFRSY